MDIVPEKSGTVAGAEIKAAATVTANEMTGHYHRPTPYAHNKKTFLYCFLLGDRYYLNNSKLVTKNRVLSFISQGCLETGNIQAASGKINQRSQ